MDGLSLVDFKDISEKIFSGAIAGIVGTFVIQCFVGAIKQEGFRSLYRGLGANLIGVTPEKAIKLSVNDICRNSLAAHHKVDPDKLSPLYGALSGAIAGFCQVIATNPMEIVKIQMQLDFIEKKQRSIRQVVSELGIGGLYRGTIATLMRDVPFSVVFFQSFASIKHYLRSADNQAPQLGKTLMAGMLAGAMSAFLATPMDVVKTRLQSPSNLIDKKSISQIYSETYRNHGLKGFFRGSPQRCMIVAPLFAISLVVYEAQQDFLQKRPLSK